MVMFKLNKLFTVISGICVSITLFGGIKHNDSYDIKKMNIQQEIDDYMMHFIELYSGSAMDESNALINIDKLEVEFDDGRNTGTLVKYSDKNNSYLRYQINLYGETNNVTIDYYLCNNFVLISRQINYYSSWILTEGWDDVLYSEIDKWIIWNDNVYNFLGDGQLIQIEKEQLDVPMLDEVEGIGG